MQAIPTRSQPSRVFLAQLERRTPVRPRSRLQARLATSSVTQNAQLVMAVRPIAQDAEQAFTSYWQQTPVPGARLAKVEQKTSPLRRLTPFVKSTANRPVTSAAIQEQHV